MNIISWEKNVSLKTCFAFFIFIESLFEKDIFVKLYRSFDQFMHHCWIKVLVITKNKWKENNLLNTLTDPKLLNINLYIFTSGDCI